MIEHIKSVFLFLLVASSLLLTYALWTYQPNFDPIEQTDYIDDSKLDGKEQAIKEVITPDRIIMHDGQLHTQLQSKQEENELYNEILNWQLSSELRVANISGLMDSYAHLNNSSNIEQMEIVYPVHIPMNLVDQIFTVNIENNRWSNLTFNRVYLQIREANQNIRVIFASEQEDQQNVLVGEIHSPSVYERVHDLMERREGIVQLDGYDFGSGELIYLPIETQTVTSFTLLPDQIDPILMRNALFRNPSVVRSTSSNPFNESNHYTDGTRALKTYRVLNSKLERMEFINPLSSDSLPLNPVEIIRRSVNLTNDHLGWTNEFNLDAIRKNPLSSVLYRMYFNGYPIYDEMNVTVMEQVWGSNELNKLKRPLFSIYNVRNDDAVLASGEAVHRTLQDLKNQISLESIEQIRIGYTLRPSADTSSKVLTLNPEWYIKLSSSWIPISDYSDKLMNQGVE